MTDHPNPAGLEQLFTDRLAVPVTAVAALLGVSHGALAAAIRRGDFPHHRIGRRVLITRGDLEAYLAAGGVR